MWFTYFIACMLPAPNREYFTFSYDNDIRDFSWKEQILQLFVLLYFSKLVETSCIDHVPQI